MSKLINQADIAIVNGFYPDEAGVETAIIPCELVQHGQLALFTIKDGIYWHEQALLSALELLSQHQRRIDTE